MKMIDNIFKSRFCFYRYHPKQYDPELSYQNNIEDRFNKTKTFVKSTKQNLD